MHSKLQLLAHPTHLRIVVPSANLVPYDWGESGVMENVSPTTEFLVDSSILDSNTLRLRHDTYLTRSAFLLISQDYLKTSWQMRVD